MLSLMSTRRSLQKPAEFIPAGVETYCGHQPQGTQSFLTPAVRNLDWSKRPPGS
jgi:hypothetical protein